MFFGVIDVSYCPSPQKFSNMIIDSFSKIIIFEPRWHIFQIQIFLFKPKFNQECPNLANRDLVVDLGLT
jgi:hypothetical protein